MCNSASPGKTPAPRMQPPEPVTSVFRSGDRSPFLPRSVIPRVTPNALIRERRMAPKAKGERRGEEPKLQEFSLDSLRVGFRHCPPEHVPAGLHVGNQPQQEGPGPVPPPRESCSFSSLGFLCLGHSAPRSRAEDASSFCRGLGQPCAARSPGTPGTRTEHPASTEAQAASTPRWRAGRQDTASSSPAASARTPGHRSSRGRSGRSVQLRVGWSHRAGALSAACIRTLAGVVQRPRVSGLLLFGSYNSWKK